MRVIVFVLLMLLPATAHAKWLEASSEHFVIYADDSDKDIRRFADQLERYHAAMAYVTGSKLPAPSPSNRVTIYVVNSDRDVRKLHDGNDRYVKGFYLPRAGGSLAVVPRVNAASGVAEWSMIVLLHEYAHHFVISTSSFPLPRWLSEGTAEFFASASFERDGSVWIGRAAQHRAGEIFYSQDVDSEELLDPDAYDNHARKHYDAYYGKSWLLYHYLTFDEERKGQLTEYIDALASGKTSREAALAAFGDFKTLDKDLAAYLRKRRMLALRLQPEMLTVGPISVRELTEGEAAMMPVRVRSRVGVTEEQAAELVVEARAIAARYPKDPAVLAALAEAEFDSGNHQAAVNAADAALSLDPKSVNAYVQKGYALFELATDAADSDAAYKKAREPFLDLNQIENDHPIPLIYYYRSFIEMGLEPTRNAKDGLEWAAKLAPFDLGLRMNVAQMLIRDGNYRAARLHLVPIAYNPHGGSAAESARAILASIEDLADRTGSKGEPPGG
jgi:tetratricopeptide (TPR) repeat protein